LHTGTISTTPFSLCFHAVATLIFTCDFNLKVAT
jgi:hypothetical protein